MGTHPRELFISYFSNPLLTNFTILFSSLFYSYFFHKSSIKALFF